MLTRKDLLTLAVFEAVFDPLQPANASDQLLSSDALALLLHVLHHGPGPSPDPSSEHTTEQRVFLDGAENRLDCLKTVHDLDLFFHSLQALLSPPGPLQKSSPPARIIRRHVLTYAQTSFLGRHLLLQSLHSLPSPALNKAGQDRQAQHTLATDCLPPETLALRTGALRTFHDAAHRADHLRALHALRKYYDHRPTDPAPTPAPAPASTSNPSTAPPPPAKAQTHHHLALLHESIYHLSQGEYDLAHASAHDSLRISHIVSSRDPDDPVLRDTLALAQRIAHAKLSTKRSRQLRHRHLRTLSRNPSAYPPSDHDSDSSDSEGVWTERSHRPLHLQPPRSAADELHLLRTKIETEQPLHAAWIHLARAEAALPFDPTESHRPAYHLMAARVWHELGWSALADVEIDLALRSKVISSEALVLATLAKAHTLVLKGEMMQAIALMFQPKIYNPLSQLELQIWAGGLWSLFREIARIRRYKQLKEAVADYASEEEPVPIGIQGLIAESDHFRQASAPVHALRPLLKAVQMAEDGGYWRLRRRALLKLHTLRNGPLHMPDDDRDLEEVLDQFMRTGNELEEQALAAEAKVSALRRSRSLSKTDHTPTAEDDEELERWWDVALHAWETLGVPEEVLRIRHLRQGQTPSVAEEAEVQQISVAEEGLWLDHLHQAADCVAELSARLTAGDVSL